MKNKLEEKKVDILEVCAEDVCISSNCWSSRDQKTEEEAKIIIQAIKELVDEKLIIATEEKYDKNRTYREVPLDIDRLTYQVQSSMNPDVVFPDDAYWFYATKAGEEQDQKNRKNWPQRIWA